MSPRLILITGCSGGGKSTLLAALAARGYATIPEPGRRIVQGGGPLPWLDPDGFARRALAMGRNDLRNARALRGPVFFDRGVLDAALSLPEPLSETIGGVSPYACSVFLAPPWPAIYERDPARRHGLDAAVAEYHRICAALPVLGHRIVHLPRASVKARVRFVLARCIARPRAAR